MHNFRRVSLYSTKEVHFLSLTQKQIFKKRKLYKTNFFQSGDLVLIQTVSKFTHSL